MKQKCNCTVRIFLLILPLLLCAVISFAQNPDKLTKDIYDRVEITGDNFKIALGYTVVPTKTNTGESQSGIPPWVWVGTGAAGGIITYALITGNDSNVTSLVAANDNVTIPCNGSGNLNVLTNDMGSNIEVTNIQNSSTATIEHTGNGNITISNVGSSSFSFTYTVQDDQNQSSSATVSVNVASNDLIVNDDSYTFDLGMTISGNVLSNDIGSDISVIENSPASNGTLTITATGDLQYTPDMDFCGQENITYLVTDICGQEASGNILITGTDTEVPTITCPIDITIGCNDSLDPSITGQASAEDNCSDQNGITIDFFDDTSSLSECNSTGIILRTWQATDAAGQSSSCVQQINVQDSTNPEITCPVDVSISCSDDHDPSVTGTAEATDNCGLESIVYDDDLTSMNGCNNTGIIKRTWTATDSCGNVVQCEQTITILEDQTAPEIVCPADISILCGDSTEPSNTGSASATDNCGAVDEVELVYEDGSIAPGCNPHFLRTWTATDSCGNITTCDQMITMMDGDSPTITCPQDTVIACSIVPIPDVTGYPTVTDDCGANGVDITYNDEFTPNGPCAGVVVRTWTATDSCGNSISCNQQIELKEVNCDFTYSLSTSNASCGANNGTAFLFVTPGNNAMGPFSIEWSDGQTGNQAVGLSGGMYQSTITDTDLGCSVTVDVQIVEDPPDFIDNIEVIPESCSSVGDILIDLQSPGSGPMMVDILLPGGGFVSIPGIPNNSTFVLTDWVQDPPSGDYTFIITDQSIGPQCQQTISVNLPQGSPFTIFLEAVIPPSSPTASDGEIHIVVEPVGAFPPFEVYVNNQLIGTVNALNFIINNVPVGFYTIFLINSQGCFSNVLEVQVNPGLSLQVVPPTSQALFELPNMVLIDPASISTSPEHPVAENELHPEWLGIPRSTMISIQYPLSNKSSIHVDLGYAYGQWIYNNSDFPLKGSASQVMVSPTIRWTLSDTKIGRYYFDAGYQFRKTSISTPALFAKHLFVEDKNNGNILLRLGSEYTLRSDDILQLQLEWLGIKDIWNPSIALRFKHDIKALRPDSSKWVERISF